MLKLKTCTVCKKEKQETEFNKQMAGRGNLKAMCKVCAHEYGKKYRELHKEYYKKYKKKYSELHKKEKSEYNKAYRQVNKERLLAYDKSRYDANKTQILAVKKKYNKNNREKINKQKIHRRNTNPKNKLHHRISERIRQSLHGRKGGRHWEALVGYTISDLKKHLEKSFLDGMTWENYGPVWHVDHKIPISAHNFTRPEHEDFKRCWALSNLQPLWAKDNMIKKDKLTKHFQPSLMFE